GGFRGPAVVHNEASHGEIPREARWLEVLERDSDAPFHPTLHAVQDGIRNVECILKGTQSFTRRRRRDEHEALRAAPATQGHERTEPSHRMSDDCPRSSEAIAHAPHTVAEVRRRGEHARRSTMSGRDESHA